MEKCKISLADKLAKIKNRHFSFDIYTGKTEAEKKYKEMRTQKFYLVRLVESNHEYSAGYWVECFWRKKDITELSGRDYVLKQSR